MINDYIAEDGGCRLDLNDKAVLDGQATTANQNPVLFLAYLARVVPYEYYPIVLKHAMCCNLGYGRYIRRHGDPLRQSHDNVTAWAWWSLRLNLPIAEAIYNFAKWRFWIYDPHYDFSLDPRCLLQGSHVFTLKLAAGKKPGWLSTIWFAGSCLVTDHASGPYLLSFLETDIVEARWNLLSPLKQKLLNYAMGLMMKRRGDIKQWADYFQDTEHPFRKALR